MGVDGVFTSLYGGNRLVVGVVGGVDWPRSTRPRTWNSSIFTCWCREGPDRAGVRGSWR